MYTTQLNIIKDNKGIPSYTLAQSNMTYSGILANAGNTAEVYAPTDYPGGYTALLFWSTGSDLVVSTDGDAAYIPEGTAPVLTPYLTINRPNVYVAPGGLVSITSPQDGVVYTIEFHALT